jgi:putative photosynthetic complex assembly protein
VHEEAIDAKPFPRGMLIAAGAMIGLSLIFAASARLWDFGATRVVYAPVVEQRDLMFADAINGSVDVIDAGKKQLIAELKPGQDGFVRVVMRGHCTRHSDDALTLTDLATGEVVMLNAFGGMNRKSFEQFLAMGRTKP